jgi:outer membrane receptor protein involved in Fe transport
MRTPRPPYSYDEDWSFVGIAPGWEYQSFDEYRRDRTMTSLEWRVQPLSDGRTAWILGTLLRHQRETLTRDYSYLPGPFSSKIETDTGAVFAEVNRAFTDTLSGFIGARLERRESHYRDSAAVNTPFDHDYWTGRTGLTWTYQRGQQTYLTLSRGARAGGANASLLASIEALPDLDQNRVSGLSIFDEETLISLEWGWQGFWPESIFSLVWRYSQWKEMISRSEGRLSFLVMTAVPHLSITPITQQPDIIADWNGRRGGSPLKGGTGN